MPIESRLPPHVQIALLRLIALKEPTAMSDEELAQIVACGRELEQFLTELARRWPHAAERELLRRTRKAELEQESTEELKRQLAGITSSRARLMADDPYDELPDSVFEGDPFESDEDILRELLQEREAAAATPTA